MEPLVIGSTPLQLNLKTSFKNHVPSYHVVILCKGTVWKMTRVHFCTVTGCVLRLPRQRVRFFLQGQCSKGNTCPFMHTKEPLPTETKEEEHMCSICYNVCGTLRKFGLLSNCDHVFCLDCIRTWRVSSKANGSHTCPMCRVKSHFVIPSLVYATGAQKKRNWRTLQNKIEKYSLQILQFWCWHVPIL